MAEPSPTKKSDQACMTRSSALSDPRSAHPYGHSPHLESTPTASPHRQPDSFSDGDTPGFSPQPKTGVWPLHAAGTGQTPVILDCPDPRKESSCPSSSSPGGSAPQLPSSDGSRANPQASLAGRCGTPHRSVSYFPAREPRRE